MEVETMSICAPHCLNWVRLTAEADREEALNYLIELGKAIHLTDKSIEAIYGFQVSTKSLQETSNHPPLIEALDSLSKALDDLMFLFNQNWFSFKEMFEIAKKKLNES